MKDNAELTLDIIKRAIKSDKRIDQNIDTDEPFKAIVHLNDGWTWNALDGNRSVEGFVLSGNPYEQADNVAYLKQALKSIEPIQ